jgi:hypothetical protein
MRLMLTFSLAESFVSGPVPFIINFFLTSRRMQRVDKEAHAMQIQFIRTTGADQNFANYNVL